MSKILIICEGEVFEPKIINSIKKYFEKNGESIVASFKTHIYTLYKKIEQDPYLNIVDLVREKDPAALKGLKHSDFSQIFLFFDLDAHVPGANQKIIEEMLKIFNNETESGLLYLSYPMAEALKHKSKGVTYTYLKHEIRIGNTHSTNYKKCTTNHGFDEINKYTRSTWHKLASYDLRKMNYLINKVSRLPKQHSMKTLIPCAIHDAQKPLIAIGKTWVLSPFPLFIVDAFGYSSLFKNKAM